MSKKLRLKKSLGESESKILKTTAPISHLNDKIRFSFLSCDIKKYCIRKLDNNEITRFYKRLGYFEGLTWQQIKQIKHEKGFCSEKKDSKNFSFLSSIFEDYNNFLHFRVNGTSNPFRVFGSQKEDLCYLLLIDKEGSLNH